MFIGNLGYEASETDVGLFVEAVAPVVRVGLPRRPDGSGTGVAFVELERVEDAGRVVAALNGSVFQGRALRVEVARTSLAPRSLPA